VPDYYALPPSSSSQFFFLSCKNDVLHRPSRYYLLLSDNSVASIASLKDDATEGAPARRSEGGVTRRR